MLFSLTQDLQQMRQNLQIAELQRKQHEEKMDSLQKELAQAMSLATKFQEKTEKLENELTNCCRYESCCLERLLEIYMCNIM